jgi:hypothetical protein
MSNETGQGAGLQLCETLCVIIVILLVYIIWRSESFVATFSDTLKAKEFNFKNNAQGYSQADTYLETQLNRI